ncbi:hypothetical protein OG738_00680 [Amycolatopsis sp. NBC_01488]|uniref:hypothetical protein n=1 Tax=Amycolatopsis sp. NBC_01488 TaxID=2903563 RepID=UPI002E2A455C|nr:hypothetical protein [Amycolatopsis sp. NBC_01488]
MLDNGIPVRIPPAPRPPGLGVHRRYAAYYAMSASIMLLAGAIWLSTRVRPNPAWHDIALFAHLASLVVGLGAVLVADYFFALWAFGRLSFAEAVHSASRLHLLVWTGLTGLVASGALLAPDLGSAATVVKLCLVGVLAVNGVHATVLGKRMALVDDPVPVRLLVRGGLTTAVSQLCWWGAVVIGFLNATR